jgi:hypothetical protein
MANERIESERDAGSGFARAWQWLDSAHDLIFSEANRTAMRQLAIRLSIAGFVIHLLLIFLARRLRIHRC